MTQSDSDLPIAPELATVRDGIEAELPGVKWLPGTDVFSPAKSEQLEKQSDSAIVYC